MQGEKRSQLRCFTRKDSKTSDSWIDSGIERPENTMIHPITDFDITQIT